MTITINGNFVLDQTTGLQTGATTDTGNDVSLGSLPSAFSTRLSTLGFSTTFASTVGVGKSADDFIAVTGGATVTSLSLLDINGSALNGDASNLFTLEGKQVYLYLDATNPNIVLGREGSSASTANASGDIVLAIYLEPNAALTQARMWSILSEPLSHPDGTNSDDRIDLGNNLKIGATSVTTFSFANAPSGDNLFLAFGSTSSAIVVTGLNPNNNNTGSDLDKAGGFSSVNSGQGGGGTTLGTGIQGIALNDGMIFTYVTGMTASFLASASAGGLDQNEADSEQNIQFTGLNATNGASFKVVKMSKNVAADVKIAAYSTAVQSGTQFVDGLGDDGSAVAINSVTVNGVARAFTTNADGSVTVTGINQDDVIAFTTTGQHNRVHILNASGAGGPNFSLGSFGLMNTATDLVAVGQAVDFDDDGPSAALAPTANQAITDESTGALAGDANAADEVGHTPGSLIAGSPAVIGWAQATVVSTSGTTFGTDGGSFALSLALKNADANGGVDSGLDATDGTSIFLFKEGSVVVGRIGATSAVAQTGQAVFAVSISNAGVLTVEQYDSVKHLNTGSHDELIQIGSGKLFAVNTATDNDTDPSTAEVDLAARFGFEDDGPTAALTLKAGVFVTVDESVGADAADANADDETAAGAPAGAIGYKTVTGATLFNQSSDVGEDDEGASTAHAFVLNSTASGLTTSDGQTITLVKVSDTLVRGVYGAANAIAFTIALGASSGDVTLTQFKALDQPTNPLTYDEAVSIQAGSLSVRLTATDGDGDTSSATGATVDLGPRLSFEDDGPKMAIDPNSTDGGDLNVANTVGAMDMETFQFDPGSDGSGGFCITDAPDTGGYDFRYVNGSGQTVTGPTGSIIGSIDGTDLYSLSINASGKYTFTLLSALPGTSLALDTNDIKAGAPSTNSIDVGTIGDDAFVRIIGGGGAINESNANVGVKNGNLDSGESLTFKLFDDTDPTMAGAELQDISSITVGTKTSNTTTYQFQLFDDGNLVFTSGNVVVGKNGSITLESTSGVLFDTAVLMSVNGNAVKIGLSGIFIEILPEDQSLDFSAVLKDGDGDETASVGFEAHIDGDGDGVFSTNAIPLVMPAFAAEFDLAADRAARFVEDMHFQPVHAGKEFALYHLA